jgi:DinB superfamily
METPTTKAALIAEMEIVRREWETLLSQLDEKGLSEPGIDGNWSVKQIVAHIAGYEEWAAAFAKDRLDPNAGILAKFDAFWQQQLDAFRQIRPDFPAHMSETDDDQTNDLVVYAYDRYTSQEVLDREHRAFHDLLAAVKALSDSQLAEPFTSNSRSLLAILPNQSFLHYKTHMPAVRSWAEQRARQTQAETRTSAAVRRGM